MIKRTRILSLALSLIFLLVLAGCGQSSTELEDKEASEQDEANQGETVNEVDYSSITWDSPDISWKQDTSPVTFTAYIDYGWWQIDTWGVCQVTQEITKRTGVSMDIVKGTDRTYLQVLLASGELPELVYTDYLVQRFWEPKVSYPWNELIEEYAPEYMHLIDPIEIVNNTAQDGNFYTLKSHYANNQDWKDERVVPSPGSSSFHIREDIMNEIGNPDIETIDDLLDVYEQVRQKYPDMLMYVKRPGSWDSFALWYGCEKNLYVDSDTVSHYISNPGWFEYFKLANNMYRKGYFTKEIFAYAGDQYNQVVSSGNVFSVTGNAPTSDQFNEIFEGGNTDAKLTPLLNPLKVNGEMKYVQLNMGTGWSSTFITKNNKNPDRAIRYIEFLNSPEGQKLTNFGIEGEHFTLNKEGLLSRPDGFEKLTINDTGIGLWCWRSSGMYEGISISSDSRKDMIETLKAIKPYVVRNPALSFSKPAADTDELTIMVQIDELFSTREIEIITASSEAEAIEKYNQMMEDAKAIGLEQLNNYMTEKYAISKVRYETLLD